MNLLDTEVQPIEEYDVSHIRHVYKIIQNIHVQGKGLLKANCYGPYISDVLSFNREFVRLWLLVEINCAPFRPFPSPCFVKLPSVRRLHN